MAGKNIRRKKANKNSLFLVVIGAAILSLVLFIGIFRMRTTNAALELNKEALEANVSSAEAEGEILQEEKDRGLTEKDIIAIAREKFGLIFKNEIIFMPDDEE